MGKKDLGLILAIVFASAAVSGSLVFFGMRVTGSGGGDVTVEKIEQGFENFVKKQQEQALKDQQLANSEEDKKNAEMAKNVRPVSRTEDHIRGDVNAEITLIEYSDFECPFCKKFHPTAQQILDSYGGKVNWVYRHYPLGFHDPLATKEAEASECANELGGNDKFWAYADLIYKTTSSGGNGLTEDDLVQMAKDVGLNQNAFTTCLSSGKYLDRIKKDIENGEAAGVSGTPGNLIVNNKTGDIKSVDGAQPFGAFKVVIDAMLK